MLEHVHARSALYSALHGTAMRHTAERRNLDESIEELVRDIADGRNDISSDMNGRRGVSDGRGLSCV
jgi:hypothetical protein